MDDQAVSEAAEERGAYRRAVEEVRSGVDSEKAAAGLLAKLSKEERLSLLDGDDPFWPGIRAMLSDGYNTRPIVAGAVDRLGIPGIRFSDGPRGAVIGASTCFPVSMARGATWDPELEERVGEVIGKEIRAQGGNFFGGVCINLLRHPAWGRAQETYGEDPVLLGAMGAALARGAQRHVMACVKHFACNSMENARFTVDVRVDEGALHEVYLPHFRTVVDAGVAAVMSAYNSVNGEWCGQNRMLLTDVLREQWGFRGFVVSDFIFGLRDAPKSLRAGLDVEMPFAQQRAQHLPAALEAGTLSWEDVDRAALRIIATQLRFSAALDDSSAPDADVVAAPEHRQLAREVASRAIVLLRNEAVGDQPALPLDPAALRRVAVIGRLADVANLGDRGSSDVRVPSVVTPLAGLRAALPDAEVVHDAEADVEAATSAAAAADVAVVVVGYTDADEGEYLGALPEGVTSTLPPDGPDAQEWLDGAFSAGAMGAGDRDRLTLHPEDEALIRSVAAANPRTVVAVEAGSAVIMEAWRTAVPAIVMLWYPGMEGGHALADVLCGRVDASGRLPFVIPASEEHLPPYDKNATVAHYDRWHGQRLLDRNGITPAFPFGYGLSYTSFAIADLETAVLERTLAVSLTVTNTGARPGRQVVQLYAAPEPLDGDEPLRLLLGFACVDLEPGASRRLDLEPPLSPLAQRDPASHRWQVRPGRYRIEAAAFAGDPAAAVATVELP
jgi:beta-glucosidase-like glycosyl hydrolase